MKRAPPGGRTEPLNCKGAEPDRQARAGRPVKVFGIADSFSSLWSACRTLEWGEFPRAHHRFSFYAQKLLSLRVQCARTTWDRVYFDLFSGKRGKKGEERSWNSSPLFRQIFKERRRLARKDAGGCWEEKLQDVSVRGTVGSGHCAHIRTVRAAAAGAHPPAVEPPLEPDAGQGEQPAAAEGLHGLAAGGGDLPLAVPGKFSWVLLWAWSTWATFHWKEVFRAVFSGPKTEVRLRGVRRPGFSY